MEGQISLLRAQVDRRAIGFTWNRNHLQQKCYLLDQGQMEEASP